MTESELLNIQRLPYSEVNNFLQNKGWTKESNNLNQTNRYFLYHLDFSVDKWQIKTTNFHEGYLFLYFKQGIPNLIIYHATNDCYSKLLESQNSGNKRKISNNSYEGFLIQKNTATSLDFRSFKKDNSSSRFSVLVYNQSSISKLIQIEKDTINAIEARRKAEQARIKAEKIASAARLKAEEDARVMEEKLRVQRINKSMRAGDSLVKEQKFEEAKLQYIIAKNNLIIGEKPLLNTLEVKIQNCIENNHLLKTDILISSGDSFYSSKYYKLALSSYKDALSYLNANLSKHKSLLDKQTSINNKIFNTQSLLDVLELRKQDHSYKIYNPVEYKKFITINYSAINNMFLSNKGSGSILYNAVIKFDTLGTNKSTLRIKSSSDKKLNSYIYNINISGLQPTQKLNYFIPTSEDMNYNIVWVTKTFKASYKKNKIQYSTAPPTNLQFNSMIERFINKQSFRNGTYKIEQFEKSVNGNKFNDLKLINYRNNLGPMKFLYSVFLPGLGKYKITEGQKGKGTVALFLVSAAVAVGGKIYSDFQYDNYKQTENSSEMNEYYDAANIANKVFLVSGGIAATIYLYDIFWVFGKGIRNNNQTKVLKSQLKNAPIILLESPVKPAANEIQ